MLSILPSLSEIALAMRASEPGSLNDWMEMRAGKRIGSSLSMSQRTSSQRSGESSKATRAGDWIG